MANPTEAMPLVREETPEDAAAIRKVTELAFHGLPHAGGDEQDIVERLRRVGDLSVSLVAELDGAVIGQITFSPAENADGSGPWFTLGPVSVIPPHQGMGIGAMLIETGMAMLKHNAALGCVLLGNPLYYQRFGFEVARDFAPEDVPAEYFSMRLFSSAVPSDRFSFHRAFSEEV